MSSESSLAPSSSPSPTVFSPSIVPSGPLSQATNAPRPTSSRQSPSTSPEVPARSRSQPSFFCPELDCQLVFLSEKDNHRHWHEVHRKRSADTDYQCACGKLDTRMDSHKRHVPSCKVPAEKKTYTYRCQRCGKQSRAHEASDYTAHLEKCLGKKGRRPKSNGQAL